MQITGGRVVYSRTVQPAQFESKRCEVELSFVLAGRGREAGRCVGRGLRRLPGAGAGHGRAEEAAMKVYEFEVR